MERSLTLKFNQNGTEHEYSVTFPNTGQLMDIVAERNRVSRGQYDTVSKARDDNSVVAFLLWDTYAYFSILVPDLFKDIEGDFFELPLDITAGFVRVYTKQFAPWYRKVMASIQE